MQIPFLHQQLLLETEKFRDMHRSMMMHHSAIPAHEMESFQQQIRKLYDLALQLGNENSMQLINEVFLANQSVGNTMPVPAVTPAFAPQIASVVDNKEQQNAIPQNHPSEVAETRTQIGLQPESIKPITIAEAKKPEVIKHAEDETMAVAQASPNQPSSQVQGQTVANKFTGSSTVGEKIAGADHSKRVSENIKLPVSDINAAIGINEKFQFINQLFHGDSQKYTQFVAELNNCPSVDAAKSSIKQIADVNHWESIPVAKHFIEVVERRFA